MNALDIIIVVMLAFFAVMSFFRGFLKEAFALGGIVLGVVVANLYYAQLGIILTRFVRSGEVSNILSYLVLFIFTAAIVSIIGKILKKFINLAFLKWLDRILGLVFGFVKGLVIVFVLVMILTAILPADSGFSNDSKLKPIIVSIGSFIPSDYFRKVMEQQTTRKNLLSLKSSSVENTVATPT